MTARRCPENYENRRRNSIDGAGYAPASLPYAPGNTFLPSISYFLRGGNGVRGRWKRCMWAVEIRHVSGGNRIRNRWERCAQVVEMGCAGRRESVRKRFFHQTIDTRRPKIIKSYMLKWYLSTTFLPGIS